MLGFSVPGELVKWSWSLGDAVLASVFPLFLCFFLIFPSFLWTFGELLFLFESWLLTLDFVVICDLGLVVVVWKASDAISEPIDKLNRKKIGYYRIIVVEYLNNERIE